MKSIKVLPSHLTKMTKTNRISKKFLTEDKGK